MNLTVSGYTYPNHFYDPPENDAFSNNIPLWKALLTPFRGMDNLKVLELGTARGRATVFLLDYILTGKNCRVDTVDISDYHTNTDGSISSTVSNLKPYLDNGTCVFHKKLTTDFFSSIGNKKYNIIYIDASHEREDVLFDAVNSFYHLDELGIIIFDDYGWGECGQGIESFLNIFSRKINLIHKGWQVVVQLKNKNELEYRDGYSLAGYWNDEHVKLSNI